MTASENPYTPWCGEHAATGGRPDCRNCEAEERLYRAHEGTMSLVFGALRADENVHPAFTEAASRAAVERVATEDLVAIPRVMPTFDEVLFGHAYPMPHVPVVEIPVDRRLAVVAAIIANAELLAIIALLVSWRLS